VHWWVQTAVIENTLCYHFHLIFLSYKFQWFCIFMFVQIIFYFTIPVFIRLKLQNLQFNLKNVENLYILLTVHVYIYKDLLYLFIYFSKIDSSYTCLLLYVLILSVPDEGYFKNASCVLNLISMLLLYSKSNIKLELEA
jgi:hypothetical protein